MKSTVPSATTTKPNGAGPAGGGTPGGAQAARDDRSVFIARQPIFNAGVQLEGYEVLYRSTSANAFDGTEGCSASRQTLDRLIHTVGLETVAGGQRVFVNFPGKMVIEEAYRVLPPERIVVELLETEMPRADLIDACKRMRADGYTLALDDVVSSALWPLLELADIVKVDFSLVPTASRRDLVAQLRKYKCAILAEKIDSKEEYEEAIALGCQYVQGYFFCRPEMMEGRQLVTPRPLVAEFLATLERQPFDAAALERLVRRDFALLFKFLRYRTAFSLASPLRLRPLEQKIGAIDPQLVRRWGRLAAQPGVPDAPTAELLQMSLVRGRFCETLAPVLGLPDRETDLFILGALSCADGIVGEPLPTLLPQLALPKDVQATLLNDPSAPAALRRVHSLATACERGNWAQVLELTAGTSLTHSDLAMIYYESLSTVARAAA